MNTEAVMAILWIASISLVWVYHITDVKKLERHLDESRKLSADLKAKLAANKDPILNLHQLMSRGVILDVSVIDRGDVFFHNGGQYR